jgi:hypothetical protein
VNRGACERKPPLLSFLSVKRVGRRTGSEVEEGGAQQAGRAASLQWVEHLSRSDILPRLSARAGCRLDGLRRVYTGEKRSTCRAVVSGAT